MILPQKEATQMAQAYAYAKPGWLVTYRHKETGELFQRETSASSPSFKPSGGHAFVSACRVALGYDRRLHDLATVLATYRTHP